MPSFARLAAVACALFLSSAAAAQEAPPAADQPEDGQEIVVTGEALEQQVRNFVEALTPATVRGQLGRFERSVCPLAVGVPASQGQAIAERMRRVADASGMLVGRAGCHPNALVVVTEDKRAFMEALRRRGLGYFVGLPESRIRQLLATPGPAVAWQTPGPPLSADGVEVSAGDSEENPTIRTTRPGSRLSAPTRVQFGNAIVIVERRALEGLTTIQLADYAAMRTFAKADPARLGEPAPETILTVLDAPMGAAVPVTLTHWDLAFLRGLYTSRGDLYAPAQRGEIGTAVREALERPDGG